MTKEGMYQRNWEECFGYDDGQSKNERETYTVHTNIQIYCVLRIIFIVLGFRVGTSSLHKKR